MVLMYLVVCKNFWRSYKSLKTVTSEELPSIDLTMKHNVIVKQDETIIFLQFWAKVTSQGPK